MKDSPSKIILNIWTKIRGGNYRFKNVIWNKLQRNQSNAIWMVGQKKTQTHSKNIERWKERLKISLFYLFSKHFIIFTKGQAFL